MKETIGIIGLGYVGLPLLLIAKKKYNVIGFDIDKNKILKLKNKVSYISDVSDDQLKNLKNVIFLNKFEKKYVHQCKIIIFCLPTPLKNNKPNINYILSAFNKIEKHLIPNQTLILESTVYPGATREIFVNKLKTKFKIGKNFFVGYSPERINPGSKTLKTNKYKYHETTKLVSGYSNQCVSKCLKFYKKIFKKVFVCSSIEIAEITKLFENIFRSVNIALVNNFKILCSKININVHEVIEAASTKGYGFKKFIPGPGIGGHCIPIDPLFLSWYAKKLKFDTKFINLAVKVNQETLVWILNNLKSKINFKTKEKILILGVAYKKNIDDIRESSSIKIIKKLKKYKNLKIYYSDPYVPEINVYKKIYKSKNLNTKFLNSFQHIILMTDHDKFNYKKILKSNANIFDCRGVYNKINRDNLYHL